MCGSAVERFGEDAIDAGRFPMDLEQPSDVRQVVLELKPRVSLTDGHVS